MDYIESKQKCAGCGKETAKLFNACSCFGAMSFSFCKNCISEMREPYQFMVQSISLAGKWPEGINDEYQKEVRRQLDLHNISEGQFMNDLEKELKAELEFFKALKND